MKKIALIHTVPTVYASFKDMLLKRIPDAIITNTVDEYLASDAEVKGEFTKENFRRLYSFIQCAEMTDPDVIAVTCSTLSPYVVKLRDLFKTPLVTIDELMIKSVVSKSSSILIVSTAESTVLPTKGKLLKEAEVQSKTLNIDNIVCSEAYTAIKLRDKEKHDNLVLAAMKKVEKKYDAIILAQASMAHLEDQVKELLNSEVYSSPKFCIENIVSVLK